MRRIDADAQSIRVVIEPGAPGGSFDVLIDGHRVWSVVVDPVRDAADAGQRFDWPSALAQRLRGQAQVKVRPSNGGAPGAAVEARFSDDDGGPELTDQHGQRLSVNKWGDLAVAIEGRASGFAARLLDHASRLVEDVRGAGIDLFLCSGSLLGALRGGALLAHDDDIDFGFVAPTGHPADLNLLSYRMERVLLELGYTVVRHSGAHLQLYFGAEEPSAPRFYLDIFTGYFRDGEYHQPFAMRGTMRREAILPLGTTNLEGRLFPAPASPDAWLALCYGPGWREPDPGFRFDTPLSTRRRFDAWFGSFNHRRDYWESVFRGAAIAEPDRRLLALLRQLGGPVYDVGAGTSGLTSALIRRSGTAVALDYALEALAIQRAAGVPTRSLNLYDRRQVLEFGVELAGSGATVVLSDVLSDLSVDGLTNARLLVDAVVSGGGVVVLAERDPANAQVLDGIATDRAAVERRNDGNVDSRILRPKGKDTR